MNSRFLKIVCLVLLYALICNIAIAAPDNKDKSTTIAKIEPFVPVSVPVRLKDLTRLRGVCDNQLIGYGLVTGLNGTGDQKGYGESSFYNMLKNLGIQMDLTTFKTKNMAIVMVTASLPAFAKSGDTIDVTVSSIADAKSIEGGILILTQLKGADGKTYATAQGPVSIGGLNFNAQKNATKNWFLAGIAPGGGLVCADMQTSLTRDKILYLLLNDPDFDTAQDVANAINMKYGTLTASPIDASTIRINNIYEKPEDVIEFITGINNIQIVPKVKAKVVINERTGTVVMGQDIKILPVAISHGNITITIGTTSQTGTVSKDEYVYNLNQGATVKGIIDALNYIGATPRDIIAIFEALKRASALPVELIIM